MGVVLMGGAKDYIVPKFLEMYNHCIKGNADILIVGDQDIGLPFLYGLKVSSYVEDMLWLGQDMIRQYCIDNNYDKMMWQCVDMLYQSEDDFKRLLSHPELEVVGALQPARERADVAVCRKFIKINGEYSEYQEDISHDLLMSGEVIRNDGFPGTGACVIDKKLFNITWTDSDCKKWYERSSDLPSLCAQEWWCLEALRKGYHTYCDTSVKTWHVHEDGIAKMYYGIEEDLGELLW